MFMSAETLAVLMSSGLSPEKVVEIYAALERDFRAMERPPEPTATDRKRAYDREYQRQRREDRATSYDSADAPSKEKVSPTPPSKTQPTLPPSPPKGGSSPKSDGFNRFWEAYPRKVGKGAARKAYARAAAKLRAEDREPLPTILTALDRVKPTWDEPEFIPHASTWLNEERWDDEPELPPPKTNGSADFARHAPLRDAPTLDELRARLDAEIGPVQ
jgi:hypothetical protein